jgi:hypothetical protein
METLDLSKFEYFFCSFSNTEEKSTVTQKSIKMTFSMFNLPYANKIMNAGLTSDR